ncbi:hypothetical protein HDE_03454 [Halotydeus destructor]|nr:hypothetical protein HDE_03454 [Halotydeus destructor]
MFFKKLQPLNWLLLFFGLCIGDLSKGARFVNRVFRVFHLSYILVSVYAVVQGLDTKYSYLGMMVIARCVTLLALLISIAKKSLETSRFVEELLKNSEIATELELCNKILAVISLGVAVLAGSYFYHAFSEVESTKLQEIMHSFNSNLPPSAYHLLVCFYTWNCNLAAGTAYALCLYLYFGIRAYANECLKQLDLKTLTLRAQHQLFLNVQKRRRSVNETLGFVPFVLCVQLFVLLTLLTANGRMFHGDEDLKGLKFNLQLEALMMMVTFIAVNMAAECGTLKANQLKSRIMSNITQSRSSHLDQVLEKQTLLLELNQDDVAPALAWNTFTLGKAFIFTFAGAFLPFAAMALPLLSDFMERKQ